MLAGEASASAVDLASKLYEACKEGDLAKAKLLLAAGAEPACRDEQGQTPLMLAAEHGDVALVKALLGRPQMYASDTRIPSPPVPLASCLPTTAACVQRRGRPGTTRTQRAILPASMGCATKKCCTCFLSGVCRRS